MRAEAAALAEGRSRLRHHPAAAAAAARRPTPPCPCSRHWRAKPELPDGVQAAVDAGRVDEAFMLLGKAPMSVRRSAAYMSLKKAKLKEAETNQKRLREEAKGRAAASLPEVSGEQTLPQMLLWDL